MEAHNRLFSRRYMSSVKPFFPHKNKKPFGYIPLYKLLTNYDMDMIHNIHNNKKRTIMFSEFNLCDGDHRSFCDFSHDRKKSIEFFMRNPYRQALLVVLYPWRLGAILLQKILTFKTFFIKTREEPFVVVYW